MKFNRRLTWLLESMLIPGGRTPSEFHQDVQPSLDVAQNGWAFMEWRVLRAEQPASTAAVPISLLYSFREDEVGLVTGVQLGHAGGAAAGVVTLRLRDRRSSPARSVLYLSESLAPGATAVSATLLPFRFPVPPMFDLEAGFPATGVGESYTVQIVVGVTRAGFRV